MCLVYVVFKRPRYRRNLEGDDGDDDDDDDDDSQSQRQADI
jgi:hypothetical protein